MARLHHTLALATTLAFSLVLSAPATAARYGGQLVEVGRTSAPAAFGAFCATNPAECRVRNGRADKVSLTDAKWKDLRSVNRKVNGSIRQVTDVQLHGRDDVWSIPVSGKGDCEDLQLLKRKMLIDLGWPSSALLMTVVRDKNGEGHAVLTVVTDGGEFVLDNRTSSIRKASATPYTYYSRQSARNPKQWVALISM